jgi:hypothetical protein
MTADIDLEYVTEILDAAARRPPMTREQFSLFTQLDVNAGWLAEVQEAERRYFDRNKPNA